MITRSRDTIVDMNETYLRIQLDSTHPNCYWRIIRRPEAFFQQLNHCFLALKYSLVTVPDHMTDEIKLAQSVDLVESNTKMFISAIDDVISRYIGLEDGGTRKEKNKKIYELQYKFLGGVEQLPEIIKNKGSHKTRCDNICSTLGISCKSYYELCDR